MKKAAGVVAGALVLAASVLSGGAVANAAPTHTSWAKVLGAVRIDRNDPTVGYVRAAYRCYGPDAPHLWVSVKQTADGHKDTAVETEGSGFGHVSATWVQSHPTDVRCNGRVHEQVFQVNELETGVDENGVPYGPVGYGSLVKGKAYVQFCLFGGDGAFVYDYPWVNVRGRDGRGDDD